MTEAAEAGAEAPRGTIPILLNGKTAIISDGGRKGYIKINIPELNFTDRQKGDFWVREGGMRLFLKRAFPNIENGQIGETVRLAQAAFKEIDADIKIFSIKDEKIKSDIIARKEIHEEEFSPGTIELAEEVVFYLSPLDEIIRIVGIRHVGDRPTVTLEYLSFLSLVIPSVPPLHLGVFGAPGSGKSSASRKVVHVLPHGTYFVLETLSSKAILYAQEAGVLQPDFNLFVIQEVEDSSDAYGALKALTDTEDSTATHWTVIEHEHRELKVPGRKAVWLCSVQGVRDAQLNDRIFRTNPDEGEEHHKKRAEFLSRRGAQGKLVAPYEEDFQLGRAITSLLTREPAPVVIPPLLSLKLEILSARELQYFTSIISALAFSRRFQRWRHEGRIIATLQDVIDAAALWDENEKFQTYRLPNRALKMLDILQVDGEEGVRFSDVARRLGVGSQTVKDWVWGRQDGDEPGLVDLGLVKAKKEGEGKTAPWVLWATGENRSRLLTEQVKNAQIGERDVINALFGGDPLDTKIGESIEVEIPRWGRFIKERVGVGMCARYSSGISYQVKEGEMIGVSPPVLTVRKNLLDALRGVNKKAPISPVTGAVLSYVRMNERLGITRTNILASLSFDNEVVLSTIEGCLNDGALREDPATKLLTLGGGV